MILKILMTILKIMKNLLRKLFFEVNKRCKLRGLILSGSLLVVGYFCLVIRSHADDELLKFVKNNIFHSEFAGMKTYTTYVATPIMLISLLSSFGLTLRPLIYYVPSLTCNTPILALFDKKKFKNIHLFSTKKIMFPFTLVYLKHPMAHTHKLSRHATGLEILFVTKFFMQDLKLVGNSLVSAQHFATQQNSS